MTMGRHSLGAPLPVGVRPPLRFREPGGRFEGEVDHPRDVVAMFEPVDVLDGSVELVDQDGVVIVVGSEDDRPVETNEYPPDGAGLYFEVTGERR